MKLIILFLLGTLSGVLYSQEIDSLKIGSGGGITGSITVYKYEMGHMLMGKGIVSIKYTETAKIKKKNRKKLIKNVKGLLEEGNDINLPGNTYQFIEIYTNGKTLKMTWKPSEIPENLLQYIDNIKAIIKNLKFVPNEN